GGLAGVLEYKSDLFDESTVAAMARNFDVLVRALVADAQEALSRLPLLIVREREELLRNGPCRASSWKALSSSSPSGSASSIIASPQHSDFPRNTTCILGRSPSSEMLSRFFNRILRGYIPIFTRLSWRAFNFQRLTN